MENHKKKHGKTMKNHGKTMKNHDLKDWMSFLCAAFEEFSMGQYMGQSKNKCKRSGDILGSK